MSYTPPGWPIFIPISLTSDCTDIVTGNTSVTFSLTIPSGLGEPSLSISYFEAQSTPTAGGEKDKPVPPMPIENELPLDVIAIPNAPTPVWENGVAQFTLDINSTVFDVLDYPQTLLVVVAHIAEPGANSLGMCTIPISLPDPGKK